jgi:4-hydroxy-4-methyl-2-oxoglutarate aldolase
MTVELSREEMDRLRSFDSPTICNAIETFKVRHRLEGYMGPGIHCIYPTMGVMLGYAVTIKINTVYTDRPINRAAWFQVLEQLKTFPEPRVLVMQDESESPCRSSFPGEIVSSTLKRLGVIGLITNGAVRDVEQVRAIGFHYLAGGIVVSHGKVEVVASMVPVTVSGLTVKPGDLLHADLNGVVHIPGEIAKQVAQEAQKIVTTEAGWLELIRGQDFSPVRLLAKIEGK